METIDDATSDQLRTYRHAPNAVPLIFGRLTADDYEDAVANDPRIDALRAKMEVVENKRYSVDYLDPEKRSIANALQIFFKDGTATEQVVVEYPIGHRRRRAEGIPLLVDKFTHNLSTRLSAEQASDIMDVLTNVEQFEAMAVNEFIDLWVVK